MPAKRDQEIDALEAVYGALKELSPDVRMRVLKGVYALLGIQGAQADQHFVESYGSQPKASAPSENDQQAKVQSTDSQIASSGGRQKSLMELILDKQPETNIERIVLFAYYREKYEGKQRFGRDDLEPYFAKARLKPPKNYSRDFGGVVKKGWIHEDKSDSYITSRGIEAVESGFATEKPSNQAKPKSHSQNNKKQVGSKQQPKKVRARTGKS